MTIVRKVKDSVFGTVKVALSAEDKMLYCLQDLCKLMGLNIQNIIALLGNDKVVQLEYIEKKNKTKKSFVDREGLEFCIRSSKDKNADYIGVWLKKVEKEYYTLFQDIKPSELKDTKVAKRVLNRMKELEKIVSVLELKIEEDAEKVTFVNSIYGSKVPIDMAQVPGRIKFRNLAQSTILEDLRAAGVLNERNEPAQKYIDEGYFRFVTVKSMIGTTEMVTTKTLVYTKGIKLIESIIKKRVGNDGRKKS